ncbi:MAG: hypothetical protein Cons2KO_29820 [Congregibacter sp.]
MTPLVCMATYNGMRFVREQLDSILKQSLPAAKILISDDGSDDGTPEILADFAKLDPRIELLPPRSPRGNGACGNFEYLLKTAQTRLPDEDVFIALADQDDIWLPHKLETMADVLRQFHGCYSDLTLMHADGHDLGDTLLQQLRAPSEPSLRSLLAQNAVPGCALALRREMLALALPFPKDLVNHDWWLAVCLAAQGTLAAIDEPLLRYRQHAGNAVGAYRPLRQLMRLSSLVQRQQRVLASQRVAVEELVQRLEKQPSPAVPVLENYVARLAHRSSTQRVRSMLFGPFAAPLPALRMLRAVAAFRLKT